MTRTTQAASSLKLSTANHDIEFVLRLFPSQQLR